jgi:hypothetical protein
LTKIWSRRVVAVAVTVATFSLFLLDPIQSLWIHHPATREALDFGGRGYISPIREAELEPEQSTRSFSDSDWWTDVASILSTEDTVEERSEAGDDSGSSKGKAKRRSSRKLIPRILRALTAASAPVPVWTSRCAAMGPSRTLDS